MRAHRPFKCQPDISSVPRAHDGMRTDGPWFISLDEIEWMCDTSRMST